MQFFENSFLEDFKQKGTSLPNKPKEFQKCPRFITNDFVFVILLKNEAEIIKQRAAYIEKRKQNFKFNINHWLIVPTVKHFLSS